MGEIEERKRVRESEREWEGERRREQTTVNSQPPYAPLRGRFKE
jgi:hypothetical protein